MGCNLLHSPFAGHFHIPTSAIKSCGKLRRQVFRNRSGAVVVWKQTTYHVFLLTFFCLDMFLFRFRDWIGEDGSIVSWVGRSGFFVGQGHVAKALLVWSVGHESDNPSELPDTNHSSQHFYFLYFTHGSWRDRVSFRLIFPLQVDSLSQAIGLYRGILSGR